MMRARFTTQIGATGLTLLFIFALKANAGSYDELAVWAKQDSDDYAQLVMQINKARSAHEVALAMKENVRRQRNTISTLLRFVEAHPDLRDAAQLGLDKEGQLIWRQQHPDRLKLPSEVVAIQEQINRRMNAADAKAAMPMATIFRKYRDDHEFTQAANEAEKMWADNRNKLLRALH
jgi:hypothetical protein